MITQIRHLVKRIALLIITISIWAIWIIVGLRSSWWLHHKLFWKSFDENSPTSWMFIPGTDSANKPTIIPLTDEGKFVTSYSSIMPAKEWIYSPNLLTEAVKQYGQQHEDMYSAIVYVELIDHGASPKGHHYEMAYYNNRGWETRWRYYISDNKLILSKWYFIRDTAGCILLPMACFVMLPLFFPARWLARKLLKRSNHADQVA